MTADARTKSPKFHLLLSVTSLPGWLKNAVCPVSAVEGEMEAGDAIRS
jgi:hypothetical protein